MFNACLPFCDSYLQMTIGKFEVVVFKYVYGKTTNI